MMYGSPCLLLFGDPAHFQNRLDAVDDTKHDERQEQQTAEHLGRNFFAVHTIGRDGPA